jgi:hypothetical protein
LNDEIEKRKKKKREMKKEKEKKLGFFIVYINSE